MRNPFNNEDYGLAWNNEGVTVLTTEASIKLSKAEARLLARALIAALDNNQNEASRIIEEAERAVNSVGSYYAPDGTLMNANGTRSVFDDVDK